jgi:hypothetical protein
MGLEIPVVNRLAKPGENPPANQPEKPLEIDAKRLKWTNILTND